MDIAFIKLYEQFLLRAGVAHNACVGIHDLTHVLLARLGLLCISSASGFSLQGSAEREGSDIRAWYMFRDCGGLVGGPESRSLVWAAGPHPVPDNLLLGELPPWLGPWVLICSSEQLVTGEMFTLQVLNEVRSILQVWKKQNRKGAEILRQYKGTVTWANLECNHHLPHQRSAMLNTTQTGNENFLIPHTRQCPDDWLDS